MTDSHWLDDLDAAWDDLVQGRQGSDALDAGAHQTLGRLHCLQAAADAPLAGRSRAWSPPKRTRRRFRVPAPRFTAVHAYGLVGLLLLVTMAGAYSTTRRDHDVFGSATQLPAAGGPPLYRISTVDGSWQQIDPQTLEAVSGKSGAPFITGDLADKNSFRWLSAISKDGSTALVQLSVSNPDGRDHSTFQIYDTHSKTLRSQMSPDWPYSLNASSLSANGSRLVFFRTVATAPLSRAGEVVTALDVYDTSTGKFQKEINVSTDGSEVLGEPVIDSASARAYVMSVNYRDQAQNPGSAVLTIYDLDAGVPLNHFGINKMIRLNNDMPGPSPKPSSPEIANALSVMSDDGESLAMVSADGSKLALFDIASNHFETKAISTVKGSGCSPAQDGFFAPAQPVYGSGRLLTSIWKLNEHFPSSFSWIGYCSIDVKTGAAVFLPTGQFVPAGWFALIPFLSSDGKHFYLIGAHSAYEMPVFMGTPVLKEQKTGIFSFDPVTLEPQAQWITSVPLDDRASYGYIVSETPPG